MTSGPLNPGNHSTTIELNI